MLLPEGPHFEHSTDKVQPQAPYNAAKAAVRHLASSLAVEWAGTGIRVNCISPGYMLTALFVLPCLCLWFMN